MPKKRIAPTTRFGARVAARMQESGVTLQELSVVTGTTYQNVRRIVKGESFPSEPVAVRMAEALAEDTPALLQLLRMDQAERKYGDLNELTVRADSSLIAQYWDVLPDDRQQDLLEIAYHWVLRYGRTSMHNPTSTQSAPTSPDAI